MKSPSPSAHPKSPSASAAHSGATPGVVKPAGQGQEGGAPISAVLARIESMWSSLGPVEQRIAEFIVQSPKQVVNMSVSELAERTGSSDGSIGGPGKNPGATGFHQINLGRADTAVRFGVSTSGEPERAPTTPAAPAAFSVPTSSDAPLALAMAKDEDPKAASGHQIGATRRSRGR